MSEAKPKSFWSKPEGKVSAVMIAFLALVFGAITFMGIVAEVINFFLAGGTIYLAGLILVLGMIAFMVIDPRMRSLVSYIFKSVMRWITGLFIQIDPIAILKNYIDDLRSNLGKMDRQINRLRGQMHKLKEQILNNRKAIQSNLNLASKAKESNKRDVMILKSRKAGRLKQSNIRLEDLYTKMEVLYRVLTKMYQNSSIMMEDLEDQVKVKEQERKAIRASHSAMQSAMNIISGNKDKRYMFDQALEAIADDVHQKVGEMERFMEVSENFMSSVDLQKGIFEEQGLKMLEKWEKEGDSLLLGGEKEHLLLQAESDDEVLDLEHPVKKPVRSEEHRNQYDSFFE